jgi:hypothetical protein
MVKVERIESSAGYRVHLGDSASVLLRGDSLELPYGVATAIAEAVRPAPKRLTFEALKREIDLAGYDVDHVLLPLADFETLRADMVGGSKCSLVDSLEFAGTNGYVKLVPYNGSTRRFLSKLHEVHT